MKNIKIILLLAILTILISSCRAPFFSLGTSEQDWLKKSRGSVLIEKSTQRTVYLRGWSLDYYYFTPQGSLYQIDHGVRQPDIIIQKQNNK